jgi:hypothetical protein
VFSPSAVVNIVADPEVKLTIVSRLSIKDSSPVSVSQLAKPIAKKANKYLNFFMFNYFGS